MKTYLWLLNIFLTILFLWISSLLPICSEVLDIIITIYLLLLSITYIKQNVDGYLLTKADEH